MLIFTLGFFAFVILVSNVIATPLVALKGGQRMVQSLLIRFMNAMQPTPPSAT
jgi:hypothetical protein